MARKRATDAEKVIENKKPEPEAVRTVGVSRPTETRSFQEQLRAAEKVLAASKASPPEEAPRTKRKYVRKIKPDEVPAPPTTPQSGAIGKLMEPPTTTKSPVLAPPPPTRPEPIVKKPVPASLAAPIAKPAAPIAKPAAPAPQAQRTPTHFVQPTVSKPITPLRVASTTLTPMSAPPKIAPSTVRRFEPPIPKRSKTPKAYNIPTNLHTLQHGVVRNIYFREDYKSGNSIVVGGTRAVQVAMQEFLGDPGKKLAESLLKDEWIQLIFDRIAALFSCEDYSKEFSMRVNVSGLSYGATGMAGAFHYKSDQTNRNAVWCDAAIRPYSPDLTMALFATTAADVFQNKQCMKWDPGTSSGEALSRVVAENMFPEALVDFATAPVWLDSARPNWIDHNQESETDEVAIGCGVMFLRWLNQIVGIDWFDIVSAGGPTLTTTYYELTGKHTAWNDFSMFINERYPVGQDNDVLNDFPFK